MYDFDLLLMDVKMPKHDGIFLMREIKKNWPDIPIIVMSGYPTPETIADVLKLGATQFIPKPFRPDELMKSIRQVLQKMSHKKSFPTGVGEMKVEIRSRINAKCMALSEDIISQILCFTIPDSFGL